MVIPATIGSAFVRSVAIPAVVRALPCWKPAWRTSVPNAYAPIRAAMKARWLSAASTAAFVEMSPAANRRPAATPYAGAAPIRPLSTRTETNAATADAPIHSPTVR